MTAVVPGSDGRRRCFWCVGDPLYEAYHDREWGRPLRHDRRLFEKLALEGFQAGLSWRLVLHRRAALRAAFADFDFVRLAGWEVAEAVPRLLHAPGMIRHRGKIAAVLHNARIARTLADRHGSLAAFLWGVCPPLELPPPRGREELAARARGPVGEALAQALRAAGWRQIGPVSAQAFAQAVGMVNDHLADCPVRAEVEAERRRWLRAGRRMS